jgi:peptidoglycan hydrolase-like protein with peptidoglycan-binding domain
MKAQSKCFVTDAELSLGDGEEGDNLAASTRRLQDFLREKGHFSYKSTGYFGKITRGALMSFQRSNGLPATGIFDASTKDKAHSLYCKNLKKETFKENKEVKKEVKEETKSVSGVVKSLSLTSSGSGAVAWSVDGYSAQGYKVVWSKNAAPTYPCREGDQYQYFSDPSTKNTTLSPFAGAGTYYVRVCEYLGGKCGLYSNQITVQMAE